jgi:Cytochrome c oxidase subunit IV
MDEPHDPPTGRSALPSTDPADEPAIDDERDVPPTDDRSVPRRIFLAIGAFMVFLAVLYWFTSYEDAGTVLLALAAVLALWFGTFLWLQQRRAAAARADGEDDAALAGGAEYLPHASAWPFAIGLGAATVANGLVLGIWVIVPGAALLALGIGGFVHQTRHRL